MIKLKLSPRTEKLRPYIKEILLYSGISDVTVEINENQTSFTPDTVFVCESEYKNLEDVLAAFAEQIYDGNIHMRYRPATRVWLQNTRSGARAGRIAAVIEKAIEPDIFFGLERYAL